MLSIVDVILEMYEEVMYSIENNLFEGRLVDRKDFQKAIALWKNLPEGKKAVEAVRILKSAKREGYIVKQKDILKYAEKIEDYSKLKAKKAVRKQIRAKKSSKFIDELKRVAEKVKNTKDSDLDKLTNFELRAYLYSKGEDVRNIKFKPRNLLFRMLTAYKEEPKRALNISGKLLDVLKKYNLEIPSNHPKYKEMDVENGMIKVKYDNVTKIGTFEKKEDIKVGKVIKELFPQIKDKELANIVGDLTASKKIKGKTFKEFPAGNIANWYRKLENESDVSSCMSGGCSVELVKFYDKLKDVSILIMFNEEDKPIGRALVWRNVKGISSPYLDRTYPSRDESLNAIFNEYARSQNWVYRTSLNISDKSNSVNKDISYQIPEDVWETMTKVPYIDTFSYGNDDGLISNTKLENNKYLFTLTAGTRLNHIPKFKGDEIYEGSLYLSSLETLPEGFKFPEKVNGGLYLRGLETLPNDVKFPENCKILHLEKLKSLPQGFKFPENCKSIDLDSLESLPKDFFKNNPNLKGRVYLKNGKLV